MTECNHDHKIIRHKDDWYCIDCYYQVTADESRKELQAERGMIATALKTINPHEDKPNAENNG